MEGLTCFSIRTSEQSDILLLSKLSCFIQTCLYCGSVNHVCVAAGGLYSGEVVVWDTSCAEAPMLVQSGMSADGHREPVYEVSPFSLIWLSIETMLVSSQHDPPLM